MRQTIPRFRVTWKSLFFAHEESTTGPSDPLEKLSSMWWHSDLALEPSALPSHHKIMIALQEEGSEKVLLQQLNASTQRDYNTSLHRPLATMSLMAPPNHRRGSEPEGEETWLWARTRTVYHTNLDLFHEPQACMSSYPHHISTWMFHKHPKVSVSKSKRIICPILHPFRLYLHY